MISAGASLFGGDLRLVSIETQIADALEDFHGLIYDGWATEAALTEAAKSNGVEPSVLRQRLTRIEGIESVADRIRMRKRGDEFLHAVTLESKEFWRSKPSNAGLGYIFNEDFIRSRLCPVVETRLGRPLENHEVSRITELYQKAISDLAD